MPDFVYKALTAQGQTIGGVVRAADRSAAVAQLQSRGSFVTDLAVGDAKAARTGHGFSFGGSQLKPRQRVALLRQLAVGLSAGLPLVNALQVVSEQAENTAAKTLVEDLVTRVTAGEALSEAMDAHPQAFTIMQISMTRAGETAGALDDIMASLADFAERDQELREKLRSAAIYPLMVMGLGLVSILVIVLFILPRIMTVINETGGRLPLPTRMLMAVTDTLRSPTGIAAAVVMLVGGVALVRWAATPGGRLSLDRLKLRLPVIGTAVRRVAVSRLARTLGTLSGANIPIVESLRIVRDTLGNEALAQHLDTATAGIVRGSAIADELRDTGQFPQLLIQVIAMGERTGRLDSLLMQTADAYDKETATALQRVMSVVPVVFILILAVCVAFILAAALLPILNMDLAPPN